MQGVALFSAAGGLQEQLILTVSDYFVSSDRISVRNFSI